MEEGNENGPPEVVNASTETTRVAAPPRSAMPSDTKGAKEPNEAFFGSLLLFCLALSLLAATGYFGIAGYRYFRETQAEQSILSIESLPKPEVADTPKEGEKPPAEKMTMENPASSEKAPAIDKKTLSLKVLNGGSAKGVAGAYGEKLKQAGFAKTVVGNSVGDYTGQTLYYAKNQAAAADAIREEVLKAYPKLVVKEAATADKDASAAPFVLILGR